MSQPETPPGQQPPSGWGTPPPPASWGQPQAPPPGWGQGPPPGWGQNPPPGYGPGGPPYASYGWGGPPPAPKPGSIPLRPLGVGDIFEGTFSVLRRYLGPTLGSAALVVGTVTVMQLLLLVPAANQLGPVFDAAETGDGDLLVAEFEAVSWAPLAIGALAVGLLSFGLFVLLSGLLAIVVGQAAVGTPLTLRQAWGRAVPRLPRLLGAVLLVVLLVGSVWLLVTLLWLGAAAVDNAAGYAGMTLLTLAGIPVTVFLMVKVSLTTPAVALESTEEGPISPTTGLRRSWGLVRGAWWRTLGILVLASIIAGALSQVIAIPLGIVVGTLPLTLGAAIVASSVAAAVGQAVALPISGIVLALVYVDRRIRTEQLDVALAQAAGVELPPR